MHKILIVEDDLITATSLKTKLQSLGYSVTAMEKTGDSAVRKFEELNPDIILMDIRLQGKIDGIAAALKIHELKDIPIIFMTAFSDSATLERAKKAAPAGYILKPIDENILATTIELALSNHEIHRKQIESEERSRIISEITTDYAYSIRLHDNGQMEREWISGAFQEITGYSPDEFTDIKALARMFHPDYRFLVERRMKELLGGKENVAEYKIVTKDGKHRWLRDYAKPVFNEGGDRDSVFRIVGAAADITEEKEYEQLLIAQRDLAVGLTEAGNLESALSLALRTALSITGIESGGIFIRRKIDDSFILAYSKGLPKKITVSAQEITPETGGYQMFLADTPVYSADELNSSVLRTDRAAGTAVLIPMKYNMESIGAVYLSSLKPVALPNQTRYMLETVTGLLSVFIMRFQISKALEESEARHRIISGLISDYAYSAEITEDGAFIVDWVSGAFRDITGYTLDELKNMQRGWFDIVNPEDLHLFNREDVSSGLSGPLVIEYRIRTKQGETRWLEDYFYPIWDQYQHRVIRLLGAAKDITEKKRTEMELERIVEQAENYFHFAGVILIVLNNEGTVTKINHRGEAVTGYSEDEIVGENWFNICIPESIREELRKDFISYLDDEPGEERKYFLPLSQNDILTKQGKTRTISWTNEHVFDESGTIVGTISSGEDITEILEAEKREKLQKQRLLQADKLASLGVLVAGVGHEINNPNQAILMTGQLLMDLWEDMLPILDKYFEDNGEFLLGGENYSELRNLLPQYLRGIEQSARRIDSIVLDLKKYSRNENNENFVPLNLNDVIHSALGLMQNMIEKSTENFQIDLSGDLPLLNGSFQRLEQVVLNLLQNACQALQDRSRGLYIRTFVRSGGNSVVLEIEDEGVGIPAENIGKISDPFFTTKRAAGGTGLGMSVSSTIIADHHGLLEYDSKVNAGTTARVIFPAGRSGTGKD